MTAHLEEGFQPDKEAIWEAGFATRTVLLKEGDKQDGALRVPVDFPALPGSVKLIKL